MKRILVISLVLIMVGCSSSDLTNLDICKKHVTAYYEDGSYDRDMNSIIDNTIKELSRVKLTSESTIVFDVDETLLSNMKQIEELGYGYEPNTWHHWVLDAKASVIEPTKRLYDWAVENNVHVVLLTGRNSAVYDATIKNLNEVGVSQIDTLITRSEQTKDMLAVNYKERERKLLTEKGYEIIACVGDQDSDIEGKYTGLKVKLPNYMYLID